MTNVQRLGNFLLSLFMIVCGVALLTDPQNGIYVVELVLAAAFFLYGVRKLVYYLTTARHMVGGLSILFIGVIAIDVSVFALTVVEDPRFSLVLFLVCFNLYTGILSIARGIESRLFESGWKLNVLHGLINLVLAVLSIVFVGSDQILVAIFCIVLFYNAITRLVSVFKPTEIIYIQ